MKPVLLLLNILLIFNFVSGQTTPYSQYLDINQVNALYSNNNMMFWDQTGWPKYEVPKGSGKHALFSHSLWMSALDSADQVHLMAHQYLGNGQDCWPGPLFTEGGQAGSCDAALSNQYNLIWSVTAYDVQEFRYRFENNLMSGYTIPADIANWPANGVANCDPVMAPYFDYNGDGYYDPNDGDYPLIKGDKMLYWIFNDNTYAHGETGGEPLGVEVRCSAYAYSCDSLNQATNGVLNYTTFLNYQIINRSSNAYHDVYFGLFTDADLGNYDDDYVGFNLAKNCYYFYNDGVDGDGNGITYGNNPPAIAIALLNGALMDTDSLDNPSSYDSLSGQLTCDTNAFNGNINGTYFGDGIPDNERLGFTSFMHVNNASSCGVCESATTDPTTVNEFANFMRGYWRDGTSLDYGEDGHAGTGMNTRYAYPGDSDPCNYGTNGLSVTGWSELTAGNSSSDRRGLGNIGPVTIDTNEVVELDLAIVWTRDPTGNNVLDSLFEDVQAIKTMFANGNVPECFNDIQVGLAGIESDKSPIHVYPSPATSYLYVDLDNVSLDVSEYIIYDSCGKVMQKGVLNDTHNRVSISALVPGIYVLQLKDEGYLTSRKFAVVR